MSRFYLFACNWLLRQRDCLRRTNTCTCAALCASISINWITFALRDSSYRTFIDTCTTCDTIFANYVSHNVVLFVNTIVITFFAASKTQRFLMVQRYRLFSNIPISRYGFCGRLTLIHTKRGTQLSQNNKTRDQSQYTAVFSVIIDTCERSFSSSSWQSA